MKTTIKDFRTVEVYKNKQNLFTVLSNRGTFHYVHRSCSEYDFSVRATLHSPNIQKVPHAFESP